MTLSLEPFASGHPWPRRQAGDAVGSRYRLERIIGHGRMGAVWLATDEVLQRPVAVRLTDGTAAARLAWSTDEVRSAAALWHPNLVQIYDFGTCEGQAFLVMEYLSGGTLYERFGQDEISRDQLRQLACDLLSALAYLHERGLRHGSVVASQVHLDADGRAHLSGFGTAAGPPVDDLLALGQLLGDAPGSDHPALDELLAGLRGSRSGEGFSRSEDALAALRDCPDPAGQATQEFDVLTAIGF